jgi:hypothetical protein
MTKQHYIDFIEEKSDYGRKRQKYFSRSSFKEISIDRLKYNIEEGAHILAELEKVKTNIPTEKLKDNQELLELLDQIKKIFEVLTELYNIFAGMMEEKFKNL